MSQPDTASRSYQRVAWIYERISNLYSLGRIRAAKASQVTELAVGDRVLYAGAGAGEDAVLAARRGAVVTCIDLAPAMVERIRRRFDRENLDAEFIIGDAMGHRPDAPYDAVAANFFFNIFPEPVMQQVLARLVELVRPGGKVMIADFAPPEGTALARAFQRSYTWLANASFWAIGLAPLHPTLDYPPYFADVGLELMTTNDFRLFSFGPPTFRSVIARRV